MGNIVLLDENTINQIAAGEVIERPANVVKELLENSIDADADKITIEVKNGGKSLIKIVDNGKGMSLEDMSLSVESAHFTSITFSFSSFVSYIITTFYHYNFRYLTTPSTISELTQFSYLK